MTEPTITLIPAQPGYRVIADKDHDLVLGDEIIAWEIVPLMYGVRSGLPPETDFHLDVYPVTTEGRQEREFVRPDGSLRTLLGDFPSLDEARHAHDLVDENTSTRESPTRYFDQVSRAWRVEWVGPKATSGPLSELKPIPESPPLTPESIAARAKFEAARAELERRLHGASPILEDLTP